MPVDSQLVTSVIQMPSVQDVLFVVALYVFLSYSVLMNVLNLSHCC